MHLHAVAFAVIFHRWNHAQVVLDVQPADHRATQGDHMVHVPPDAGGAIAQFAKGVYLLNQESVRPRGDRLARAAAVMVINDALGVALFPGFFCPARRSRIFWRPSFGMLSVIGATLQCSDSIAVTELPLAGC